VVEAKSQEGKAKSDAKEVERRRQEEQAQARRIAADAEAKRVVVEGEVICDCSCLIFSSSSLEPNNNTRLVRSLWMTMQSL
jgi:hypothetical protein